MTRRIHSMSNLHPRRWMQGSFVVFAALAFVSGGEVVSAEITPARLDTFIDYATSYLVRISHTPEQDPQHPGRFTYVAYLEDDLQLDGFDEEPQKAYNLLRHNGAIYSLALSYDRHPDEQVLEAMLRGIKYLKNEAMGPVPDTHAGGGQVVPDLLAPWETNKFEYTREDAHKKKAKLGGAGLGLIALCNAERIAPGTTDLAYMRKIGNFIHSLQKDDGSFASRFDYISGIDDSWTSLYYPGEAALGLVYLFELETDDDYRRKWLSIATDTLLYLERLRRNLELDAIEPDHWALLASSRLISNLDDQSVEYWLVYNHAVRVVQSMIASHTEESLAKNNGCFTADRRTCPTATRLEGLLAAMTFIRDHEMFIDEEGHKVLPLRERMMHDIELGIDFMLQSQQLTDENNMKGAVPVRFPVKNHNEMEVRVDYVQHSMSAVLAYEARVFKGQQTASVWSNLYSSGATNALKFLVVFFIILAALLFSLPYSNKKKSSRYNE